MPYVNQRWLGGLLTNFQTMSARIDRLHELTGLEDGRPARPAAHQGAHVAARPSWTKLEYNLGGVRDMKRLPQAVLIIDLKTEAIALREAERLRIPIIGLVDSNVDPVPVDFPIPGNDDSIRSCKLVIRTIGEAVCEAADGLARGGGQAPGRGGGAPAPRGGGAQRREAEEERARKEAEEAAAKAAAEQAEAAGAPRARRAPGRAGRRPRGPP